MFHREALKTAHIALMDIDPTRLEESHIVVRKLISIPLAVLVWRAAPLFWTISVALPLSLTVSVPPSLIFVFIASPCRLLFWLVVAEFHF